MRFQRIEVSGPDHDMQRCDNELLLGQDGQNAERELECDQDHQECSGRSESGR